MRIKEENNLLIIYLYNKKLSLEDKNLIKEIKDLFNKLNIIYHYNLYGLFQVTIYENKYYGYVLEIEKIRNLLFANFIDIELKIVHNCPFYLKYEDSLYIENFTNVFCQDNSFYINLKDINNLDKVLELGEIVYIKKNNYMYKSVNINNESVN